MLKALLDINSEDLFTRQIHVHYPCWQPRFAEQLHFTQMVRPDPSVFQALYSGKEVIDFTCYVDLPRPLLQAYVDLTRHPPWQEDQTTRILELQNSHEDTFHYLTLKLNMQLPFESCDLDQALETTDESQVVQDYRLNPFSGDLAALAVAEINAASKTAMIYAKKTEVHCVKFAEKTVTDMQKDRVESFETETLYVQREMCMANTKVKKDELIRRLNRGIEDMEAIRNVYLQATNEAAAFQFRREMEHPEFLRKMGYFQLIDDDTVKELDKEEVDRDVREDWIEIWREKIKQTIKQLGL